MAPTAGRGSVRSWLRDLDSPDEQLRLAALSRLSQVPSLGVIEALRRLAAGDPSATVRFEARRHLASVSARQLMVPSEAEIEVDSGRFQALMTDPDPGTRARLVRSLAEGGERPGLLALADALPRERDPSVLCELLRAVAATADPAGQQSVRPFLAHAEPRVRAAAVEALATVGGDEALEPLVLLLDDPDRQVRAVTGRIVRERESARILTCADALLAQPDERKVRAALYALRFVAVDAAMTRLETRLRHPSAAVRHAVLASLTVLARKGSSRASELLLAVQTQQPEQPLPGQSTTFEVSASFYMPDSASLEERLLAADSEVRLAATREVALENRRDLAPMLRQALSSEQNPRVVATLIGALGRLGDPDDADRIAGFLASEDPHLRANAVHAVGLLGKDRVLELLVPLLEDDNPRVRSKAIVALHGSPGLDVIPPLLEMASSTLPGYAVSAIWAAATLGTPEAVTVLAQLARSSAPDLAKRARLALETLAADNPTAARVLTEQEGSRSQALPDTKLQRFLFDLKAEDPQMRLATLGQVATLADLRLLPATRELLHDEDPTVRHAARKAMRALLQSSPGDRGQAGRLARFEAELREDEEAVREALAGALDIAVECGVGATAQVLARRLPSEERPFVRANILSVLALVGDAATSKLVGAFVRDPDARVRANAVDALELAGSEEGLLAAITCLLDSDPRVRAAAIRAAASIDKEIFLEHLRSMLASETVADRAAGLFVVRTVEIPERFDLLREHFLQEVQPRLYELAAAALAAEARGEKALELQKLVSELPEGNKRQCLQKAFQDANKPALMRESMEELKEPEDADALPDISSSFSRVYDLRRLGELTSESVRTSLARETDPLTISCLLEAAAELGLSDAVELALPFTHSRDRRVRLAVADAVGRLSTPEATDCLMKLVRDRDAEVSRRALDRLARQGKTQALAAVRAMLEGGEPAAFRKAVELLEGLDSPESLALALELLEKGAASPGVVEPLSHLVTSRGDAATLDRLSHLFLMSPSAPRTLLAELGTALGERLGMKPEEVAGRFPSEGSSSGQLPIARASRPKTQTAPSAGAASSSRSTLPAMKPPAKRGFEVGPLHLAVGGLACLLLAGFALWALWPRGSGPMVALPVVTPVEASRPSRIVFNTKAKAEKVVEGSSTMAMPDTGLGLLAPPTLQELEESVAKALAPHGIKSPALIHLIALDRFQDDYRVEINRARDAFKRGEVDASLKMLQAALDQLDPEHLQGRLAVLRAIEYTCRLSQRFERMQEWRTQIREVQRKMIELCLQAGRDGGMPEERARAVMEKLEKLEENQNELGTACDYFAGADLDKDKGKSASKQLPVKN